ncbi:FAD-dependent thymidylate synthase [Spirulina major CS-329]|uniref:FAD-dependent thymidylate synthase n=1 Tax=Spirulina TaxID=1154 RepID=UPI00232F3D28|nr:MULTISPECIES: FAD-dependent thymidylate synthase [Spirulina]MDB9493198.1 FAD-dependent thymidylate synthase [Spirulina subsalsa CS-330]MDB9503535.1 FAD-dependent thymidylate synthase [Spirulina major CS-329]
MDKFRIELLAATPNPQQLIWAAMHQDYSEDCVYDQQDKFPSEEKAGELVIKHLLAGNKGHFGPLEHPQITVNVCAFPHSMMQQVRTHRVGVSFDVQCLAGNAEITFLNASGSLRKIKISELYDLWINGEKAIRERKIRGRNGEPPGQYRRDCKKRLRNMKLRVLNEETQTFEVGHIQNVMSRGIQPVYRLTFEDGKTIDCTKNHRFLTTEGWQTMEAATGLLTNTTYEVISRTKNCEVMCNGVIVRGIERVEAQYTQKSWLVEQVRQGLTANQISQKSSVNPSVIRQWAKHHNIELPSGHHTGLKTVVGDGCYRDKQWLAAQLAKGLYVDEIADLAGCSAESITKWVYKNDLKLNKRSKGAHNPWNKQNGGYALQLSEESLEKRRKNAQKYTKRGEESNFWKGGVSSERTKIGAWTRQIAPQVHQKYDYICQCCGVRGGKLDAHHLVPVYADESLGYEFENLVSLCKRCHTHIHKNHLEEEFAQNFEPITKVENWQPKPVAHGHKLKCHPVKIVNVEFLRLQETYDLEVSDPWHNFVANDIVVHNSNRYTGQRILDVIYDKREIEDVFYLRPVGNYTNRQGKKYFYSEEQRRADLEWCFSACQRYAQNLESGMSEEHARGTIPFDVRQHFVLSCNVRSLMHLLDLRWKKDAQLEAQKFAELLFKQFEIWCPAIAQWYLDNRAQKAKLSP